MCAMPMAPRDSQWTIDDLVNLPEDGLQYELAEGVLLVTPSPRPRHQRMSMRLSVLLDQHCPDHLEVFAAPLDYQPSPVTSLQPDLLVVRREDVGDERLEGTPLLVVEILSPTTRAKDLVLKRALYAESGVPSYWILDPTEAVAIIWSLSAGEYVETARVAGEARVSVTAPFALSFAPFDLVR